MVAEPKKKDERKKREVPRYHVMLWDSDAHTYEYVERMIRELFGHHAGAMPPDGRDGGYQGQGIVLTTTKEHAELKRDQIIAYGKDDLDQELHRVDAFDDRIGRDEASNVTLGCKVNQYETEFVREGLLSIGYEDANDDDTAELCIVNTCTVTNEGDSKSRQTIRRLARKNPGAKIVVMGCYATRHRRKLPRCRAFRKW